MNIGTYSRLCTALLCKSEVNFQVSLGSSVWQRAASLLMKINADKCWAGQASARHRETLCELTGPRACFALRCMTQPFTWHSPKPPLPLSCPPPSEQGCRRGGWRRLTAQATCLPSVFHRDECWCCPRSSENLGSSLFCSVAALFCHPPAFEALRLPVCVNVRVRDVFPFPPRHLNAAEYLKRHAASCFCSQALKM